MYTKPETKQSKPNQKKNHDRVKKKKINVKSLREFFCGVNILKSVGVNGI